MNAGVTKLKLERFIDPVPRAQPKMRSFGATPAPVNVEGWPAMDLQIGFVPECGKGERRYRRKPGILSSHG